MNFQAWIHWLEQGRGAHWLARAALIVALAAGSLVICYKQFHGPRTEETLRQAELGRTLAEGRGFATRINDAQVHAVLERRGELFDEAEYFPALYQPPGYPVVVAAALRILPATLRESLLGEAPAPPAGFGGDYLLLAINVGLLWVATLQVWLLGRRLFDPVVGGVAALALLLSTAIWSHVVAVDGTPLAMVLLLGLFQCLARADAAIDAERNRPALGWWLTAGMLAALLFLTDYPAGVLLLAVAGHARWRGRGGAAGAAILVALLIATPWLWRNVALVDSPVALAGQDLFLKIDDTTAEPEVWRATLTAEAPPPSLNKMGNKVLTAIQVTLRDRLWAGGGLFLTAFFVAGWMYRFRDAAANRLRALTVGILAVWVPAQGLMNSGEGERLPVVVAAPLIMIFGAGFFRVLAAGSNLVAGHVKLVAAGLLLLQALPLGHDLLEPRRVHFSYPPYWPSFFQLMGVEMERRGGDQPGWMADVPAGAAWYSGQRVWGQPHTLRDFYAVHVEQPQISLVLTPHTLDRPFFAELTGGAQSTSRFGEWGRIYTGMLNGRMPRDFPLSQPQKLADNFHVLIDPRRVPFRGN